MKRQQVLGRGLDALFQKSRAKEAITVGNSDDVLGARKSEQAFPRLVKTEVVSRETDGGGVSIPIDSIHPNPNQPRETLNQESIQELSVSIKKHGLISPILVRKRPDGAFELVAGQRRILASQMAGKKEIKAIIVDVKPIDSMQVSLIENLQREDLNASDEAKAYRTLIEKYMMKPEEIANQIGRSRAHVANMLRLLNLPEDVLDGLKSGKVTMGQVRPLLGLDQEEIKSLYAKITTETLSVRKIEALASGKKTASSARKGSSGKSAARSVYSDAAERIMKKIGRKVQIVGTPARGSVRIEYYSKEDLLELTDYLLEGR